MPYLQVNGVTVASAAGGVRESFDDIGAGDADGIIGNVMRQRTRRRRTWTFRTPPMVASKALALDKLIEGFGMRWPRLYVDGTASAYSSTGVTYSVNSGTVTLTTTGGPTPVPLRATIASGGYAGFRLQNRMGVHRFNGWNPAVDGFTIICWRYWTAAEGVVAGWYRTIITGTTTFARGAAANPVGVTQYRNGVAGSYNLGRCFGVDNASPFVALHGYLNTNAASAVDFADVLFLPFALPSSWVSGIDTFMQSYPLSDLPMLWLSGDGIPDSSPVLVMGRVREMLQAPGTLEGVNAATHRMLEIELRETI
jgi:hypothetical protein